MRAKLFDLSDTIQALVIKRDKKEPTIEYQFLGHQDVELTLTSSFKSEEKRDEMFNKIGKPEIELMAKDFSILPLLV